jgi:hypothetical protein
VPEVHEDVRTEESDLSFKLVALLAIGTLGILLAITLGLKPMIGYKPAQHDLVDSVLRPRKESFDVKKIFPEPRLQWSPRTDMARYRAKELARLDGLGWVDRSSGVAHVPIDTAMAMYLARGAASQGMEPKRGQ